MNEDSIQDIIRDARYFAQTPVPPSVQDSRFIEIANRLERLVEHGLYITPKAAVDAVAANSPMSEEVKKRGLVGIRFNDTAIVAWNLANNKNIRVAARKVAERAWHVDGYVADTLRISATVFGGRNATIRYVRFIRNGLTARVMRRKHVVAAKEEKI